MMKTVLKTLVACLLLLPMLVSAAEVRGTLTSYSLKEKVIVIDKKEYFVDVANLKILYKGEFVGIDGLEPGLQVLLYMSDETSEQPARGLSLMILSYKPELDS